MDLERKKLAEEVDKLFKLYQSGALDEAGFKERYVPQRVRRRQLDDEIPKAQAELDVLKISHLFQEEIVAEARDLYTRWPSLPHEEKRQHVEVITEKITVGKGEVEINLLYSPPIYPMGRP